MEGDGGMGITACLPGMLTTAFKCSGFDGCPLVIVVIIAPAIAIIIIVIIMMLTTAMKYATSRRVVLHFTVMCDGTLASDCLQIVCDKCLIAVPVSQS